MLEHWVYEEEPLELLSGHYLDRTRKLPLDIVKAFKVFFVSCMLHAVRVSG